jgi:hypothetical protein
MSDQKETQCIIENLFALNKTYKQYVSKFKLGENFSSLCEVKK